MRAVLLLLALTGCSQIFGLDPPHAQDAGDGGLGDSNRLVDTLPGSDAYITVSFQQGVASYADCTDTYIDKGTPAANRSTDSSIRWRLDTRYGLLQFQSIFGSAQIPAGSTILSARLDLVISNTQCSMGHIADVAIAWTDAVSYNTFGPVAGVQVDDVGPSGAASPTASGIQSINVTDSVVRWATDPTMNHGWIFLGDTSGGGGNNDCNIHSSDDGFMSNRPKLYVTYQP